MTEDQEMAAVGRLTTEYRDTKARLSSLTAEARRIGERMRETAHQLINTPADVDPDHFREPDRLRALVAEIRELTGKRARIGAELVEMGVLDPEDLKRRP